jgi:hypothetical protein
MLPISSFAALPLFGSLLLQTSQPETCQARLLTHQQNGLLTLTGQCSNYSSGRLNLSYELRTEKRGASGTAQNSQSGRFTVEPQKAVVLSQTTIKVVPADYYLVRLRLRDEQGRVVAQDSLLHRPE